MYANDHAAKSGKLQVYFLAPPEDIAKSDAFIVQFDGKILLIDGGMKGTDYTLKKLLDIREEYLSGHGELAESPDLKLKISALITHFHSDHVCAFINSIIPNEFMELETLFLGPMANIPESIKDSGRKGEPFFRAKLEVALKEFQPQCSVINIPFGKENKRCFSFESGNRCPVEFTILPPVADWGMEERLEYIFKYYDEVAENPQKVNLYTLNSSSLWLHIKYGKNTFLFNGDTIKKFGDRQDEALDEMTTAYSEEYSPVTVLKYVHHGISRDDAVEHMLAFKPSYLVFSSAYCTAPAAFAAQHPELLSKIPMFCSGVSDVLVECYPDTDVKISQVQ